MTITYAGQNLTPTPYESASGTALATERLVQQTPLARAKEAFTAARGNRITTLEFSVVRKFDTLVAAETFALDHENKLPATGELLVNDQRRLTNACLASVHFGQIGVSIPITYRFTGGTIQPK